MLRQVAALVAVVAAALGHPRLEAVSSSSSSSSVNNGSLPRLEEAGSNGTLFSEEPPQLFLREGQRRALRSRSHHHQHNKNSGGAGGWAVEEQEEENPKKKKNVLAGSEAGRASQSLRLLYCVCAFDRKQHVHLIQMLLSAVSMCEGGLAVRVLLYTADANPYTKGEEAELRQIGRTCTGILGGAFELEIVVRPATLRLEMTMQHRKDVKLLLDEFDVFVYAEDDVHVELRHVLAYLRASRRLARAENGDKYVLGWQRFEKTGIGLGARQVMWENGLDSWHAVDVDGELYVTMVNPHAGAWIATRDELKALDRQCHILRIPKTANSFTRVRAAGWNMYLNCGRRKILPVAEFPAFIVHHLPDKNWWQRSECAVAVPDLLSHFNAWLDKYNRGDTEFLCGDWWTDQFCRDEMQVVPAGERKRRFGVQGSCTVWRNRTSGEETVIAPNERLRAEGDIMKAREAAARDVIKLHKASSSSSSSSRRRIVPAKPPVGSSSSRDAYASNLN